MLDTKTVDPVAQWEVDTSASNSLLLITQRAWYHSPASQALYIARGVNGNGTLIKMDVTNNTVGASETVFAEEGYQYTDLTGDNEWVS